MDLDVFGPTVTITTSQPAAPASVMLRDAGAVLQRVDQHVAGIEEARRLSGLEGGGRPGQWTCFRCVFASGVEDHIAVRTRHAPEGFDRFLRSAWPGLRQLCVQQSAAKDVSQDALLWMIDQKVNAAILVLDAGLHLLQCNDAGGQMIREGQLLAVRNGALACSNDRETRALRAAVQESLRDESNRSEFILILRGAQRKAHVPMSLSVYPDPATGQKLFLAMLPMPPEQKHIEKIALELGLTPVEARVAALIRSGLSNRSAAEVAGLKVETFNTYAKRVLSKMNVSCRSEMAQMLTWQTSMERSL
ncbi:helix-turn-helix transcriptional regulator [Seohaeicola zhoushanensis]|nr:helix-turn-helix transcriptional regulator [Seohaeicola zhoushanensis]